MPAIILNWLIMLYSKSTQCPHTIHAKLQGSWLICSQLLFVLEYRLTPSGNDAEEPTSQSSYVQVPHYSHPTSSKGCASLLVHALPQFSKVEDAENDVSNAWGCMLWTV